MKMLLSDELSLGSLIEVQSRLEAAGLRTPLRATALQSEASTRRIRVKAENLQPTGSFKIRGATNAVSKLSSVQKARGVVAYSTGNHAQAVALAAQCAQVFGPPSSCRVMSRTIKSMRLYVWALRF
jgi:threonine dehydratase